jgi:hypothetical protein
MKYIVLGVLIAVFSGCGGSSSDGANQNTEQAERPISPTPKESSKQPPAIPKLD